MNPNRKVETMKKLMLALAFTLAISNVALADEEITSDDSKVLAEKVDINGVHYTYADQSSLYDNASKNAVRMILSPIAFIADVFAMAGTAISEFVSRGIP